MAAAPELDPFDYYACEDEYPDLNVEAAVLRLALALSLDTDNTEPSQTDFSQFDRLHDLMRESYPHIMRAGRWEDVGHSVLITIEGSDPALAPMQLMAHQDVVPVVPGTEDDWEHGAFEGYVDDEYVWGRGAIDIKEMLMGELEAVEYVLAHGGRFRRTLYLAFGEDEERWGTGAAAICRLHQERGVRLGFLLDEGGTMIEDAAPYGAPGTPLSCIAIAEKGFVDVRLEARGHGGHSSNPYGGTSLGHLARAIDEIQSHPFPARLGPIMRELLAELGPKVTAEPMRSLVAGGPEAIAAHADEIAALWERDPRLYPLVETTIAPTMIWGASSASNVLPQDMAAVVNLRVLPGEGVDDVMRHVRASVDDPDVDVILQQGIEPSATARTDGEGFALVREALGHFYQGVTFSCILMRSGSDAQYYDPVCDTCLRTNPFKVRASEQERGEHGTNERIPRRTYAQGIRVLIRLVERACL